MLQSHLSWSKQFDSPLARKFRLVTYDFRGHSGPDKPVSPNFYDDSAKFAQELKAVMDAAGVRRPVLVGWSFGTRIIADYLLKFGSAGLAGLNFVAPVMSPNPEHFGPGIKKLAKARDADFATSISGTKEFLRACFVNEPARDEMETMCLQRQRAPRIRRSFGRSASDTETLQTLMRSLDVPVLISHGLEDQVILPELSRWMNIDSDS